MPNLSLGGLLTQDEGPMGPVQETWRSRRSETTSFSTSSASSWHSALTAGKAPREVPSCFFTFCSISYCSTAKQCHTKESVEHAWAQADELAKIEQDLRDTLAGTSSAELQAALRRATSSMNAAIDRELMRQARRQLPVLLAREDLLACMDLGEIQVIEAALHRATSLKVDAEILAQARRRLNSLRFAWLPLSTITAQTLAGSSCYCSVCQGSDGNGCPGDTGGTCSGCAACESDDSQQACAYGGQRECAICMETYREGDTTASFPCFHSFHASCAKHWLSLRAECPMCRTACDRPPDGGGI